MHQLAHLGQLLAQLAAGMQLRKIFSAEALAQAHRNGQRIAKREHRRGRGSRREIQPAGLALHATIESHVARLGQSRLQIAAETDQRVAFALERGQQSQNFLCLSRCRKRNHHVARHQHAHIAVHGLGRMQKQRRRAGGAERGGDLLRDDAALAHAGDHHAAMRLATAENHLHCARERPGHRPVEARGQRLKRGRLGAHQR